MWNIGDIVYLKSGSPRLVISSIPSDPKYKGVTVQWFTGIGEIKSEYFDSRVLTPIKPGRDNPGRPPSNPPPATEI